MIRPLDFEDDERIGSVCWCGGCAEDPCTIREHESKAYTFGAAALAGVIGMAEAINDMWIARRRRLFQYDERKRAWYCVYCRGRQDHDPVPCGGWHCDDCPEMLTRDDARYKSVLRPFTQPSEESRG